MPRASWRGFLRLSLVSCPIYLSPATARTKPIRLHQVWQPARVDEDEDELLGRDKEQQTPVPPAPQLLAINPYADGYLGGAAARIRSDRMIPKPATRSTSARSSKDTNMAAVNS
jgi:hypothetical protein